LNAESQPKQAMNKDINLRLGTVKAVEKKRYLDNTRTNDTMDGMNTTIKTNKSIITNTLVKTTIQKQLEELDATFEYALMKKRQAENIYALNRSSFT